MCSSDLATLKIQSDQVPEQTFTCAIEWESPTTAKIQVKETGSIKGQKIKLLIDKAPTKYKGWSKNEVVTIQFKEPVRIIEPQTEILISTNESFIIRFSTPMNPHKLNKYLKSDGSFYIEALDNDKSSFKFTPTKELENGRKYILNFSKGMPALSGAMLEEDVSVVLQTDVKPQVTHTYPENNSKWIGLYPKINITVDREITKAYLDIGNDTRIEGHLKENKVEAEFILPEILKPDTKYEWQVIVEAPSGEGNTPYPFVFTTVPVPDNRLWIEVQVGKFQQILIHQGQKVIKQMNCSAGVEKYPTHLGTYYIQGKGEKFFSDEMNRGANYWLKVSGEVMLHGMLRDEYWTPLYRVEQRLGEAQTKGDIIVSEEDAKWLYENIVEDTMVIIHK